MISANTTLEERISVLLKTEHAWSYLFGVILLSILSILIVNAFINVNNEKVIRYKVKVPAQLQKDYQWESSDSGQASHAEDNITHDGRIQPLCPADGRTLGPPVDPATPSDIDSAISSAARAQKQWAQTSFSERRRVLRTLHRYVLDHQEEIVTACCLDSGKTKIDACFGEILVTAEKLQWTFKHGEKALRPSKRPTNLLYTSKVNTVFYEPMGVVAACVSWNYPFHNFISPVISALFAGDAIVVKPSEQTCWSTFYFTDLIRGALQSCGHSPDLVQNVICLPEVADYFTSHPGLSHITFIGSREVAHKVCTSAAKALTPVTVELGGKDPAIVLDDPRTVRSVDDVIAILMRGVFQSAGQNCVGTERVITLPGVHDLILNNIRVRIQNLRLGSVLLDKQTPDMGSMISSRNFGRLEKLIASAVAQGATLHCGGRRYDHPKHPNGHYFQPTLLSDVTTDMEISQTELFAPVFVLMRARSVDEAIEIANSTEYALGASVFGYDWSAVSKCVRGIKAGGVAVNDFGAFYACSMPFGGVKGSGYGRFGGEEGLRGLCNLKSISEEAGWAKMLGISQRIPPKLQYPVSESGWEICKGVVGTGYSIGWLEWISSVVGLLSALMRSEDTGSIKDSGMRGGKESLLTKDW
ncbi:Meiotic Sister-Chromatid recombination aldehyde dehydrogenase [Elasticomyces elasticus]|uniref:aldehyde dehydrogenase (NAD(+)) n=1 Tax=Exophiala sideris TaxID=1016849 RepID=A0ABR0JB47_9EURO|nr:Meiotic Sister-Chromatid recombination aldehyde dehydrogenase [Elasticomyces elasticus]KAK5030596.1 Meiotic Sister-Chromatid recombination aldehyde dehydrogenase [Exophiala sideris]KAK5038650.1 Meiotic Sister-Chromatid recombination aldehyde dehydrogenase [Exophiala sideris]KAK5060531.1 Meiotic Sister-Chromatid recombination aldehyde dehydrogenase [Exophiala sideris]KAK5183443.1 Meiotic Sister-Chromatid recombination aldehyde dehydrogenase [Eurotiomycetes sp. CCFEE 6388]